MSRSENPIKSYQILQNPNNPDSKNNGDYVKTINVKH